ncbi:MAG: DNA methyltransferase [Sphingomonadaceae bacterium PASS1]|nr:MAG: DNA methyltransferase [Sphingomonadaceae bacterium PASS1]
MKPFIKWAGGKRWLLENQNIKFPAFQGRYIEPFLGGGAVFFHVAPQEAILADMNSKLILTYQAIKSDWQSVELLLKLYQNKHSKDFYYQERKRTPLEPLEQAAQFIYLNRTCFNGLYRENLNGQFNVPIGTNQKVLRRDDDFAGVSRMLQSAELRVSDFSDTILEARAGDLVFVDPPYTVMRDNGGFLKYNQKVFSWQDQERLKIDIVAALNRGSRVVMTNADHDSIRELYAELGSPSILYRNSLMASSISFRGQYSELLYTF